MAHKETKRIPQEYFIPVNVPVVSKESKAYVNEALDTNWTSSAGPMVRKFEEGFSGYLNMRHGVAVASGTAAIHVSLMSLGLREGDEVITPAFTMGGSWLPMLKEGIKPIFVDCEPETYNINTDLIEEKITEKTGAIMPVHIYGHPADMDPIMKLARKHELHVIEDAAEVHGAEYKGRKCGSMGDINCFSFYANKIIQTGEGGMVITNSSKLAEKARRFSDLCHSNNERFIHDGKGLNYRMSNLQASVGCGELINIDKYIERKQVMAAVYSELLEEVLGLTLPITKDYAKNVYWMYAILVDESEFGVNRNTLMDRLKERGIGSRSFFKPPNQQPVLLDNGIIKEGDRFPVCEEISERGLYLPSGLAITNDQISRVAEAIIDIHQGP